MGYNVEEGKKTQNKCGLFNGVKDVMKKIHEGDESRKRGGGGGVETLSKPVEKRRKEE